jgi:hypothetical protein
MAESKTRMSGKSVDAFLADVEDEHRRNDARTFLELMRRVTGEPPRMWGDSIVGFGTYHYKYESGHEGDTCLVGFSPRKSEFSIYLTGTYLPGMEPKRTALLQRLGKHRMGKACLYVRQVSDIDLKVLKELVTMSVDALRKHYPN